jgi:menaquinone-9 beta-reductase
MELVTLSSNGLTLKNVAIVGGGLAGLVAGIELAKKGVPCTLFEKKKFPFHRVCGEYISNEALPYLKSRGLFPDVFQPTKIEKLVLTSVRGQSATLPLDLGGFGISRYTFDYFLCEKARNAGVVVKDNQEVSALEFKNGSFQITTTESVYVSDVVIGAFGKRSKLDVSLDRDFIRKRSPYVGIKYHGRTDHPANTISLHNFNGGYCGVVNVDKGDTNVCYLVRREVLQRYKNVRAMEEGELFQNPSLKRILEQSYTSNNSPLVINEISFETKTTVSEHVLMCGDAAGMITPLCGNGMAMAIHSAKLLSELVFDFCEGRMNRQMMEAQYDQIWRKAFAQRLKVGRAVQTLFGSNVMSSLSVGMMRYIKPLAKVIVKNTHGEVFH